MPYLGGDGFRAWVYQQKEVDEDKISEKEKFQYKIDMDKIINHVADIFHVSVSSTVQGARGQKNMPRWIAMFLCQERGDHRLIDIAHKFNLSRTGSIPGNIVKGRKIVDSDSKLRKKIEQYFT
ncbi:MAG: hypothetical protein HQL46_16540 [Gammaproteobacteria bacterium]|nr:hypothetical protein [Gammaproteobacteria bacterium]